MHKCNVIIVIMIKPKWQNARRHQITLKLVRLSKMRKMLDVSGALIPTHLWVTQVDTCNCTMTHQFAHRAGMSVFRMREVAREEEQAKHGQSLQVLL